MRNRYQEKPAFFSIVLILLIIGFIESLVYARGDNYLAEASAIFSFFIVFGLWAYFAQTNSCLYSILIISFSGAIAGTTYWYATSFELELWKSILYGSLIAFVWFLIESIESKKLC